MKHFAQIDENNNVVNVLVIDDVENGEEFCTNLFGSDFTYKESFLDGSQRERPAQKFGTYDPTNDAFIDLKPFPSYVLNASREWEAPVTYPNVETYNSEDVYPILWNETDQRWDGRTRVTAEGTSTNLVWNATDLAWETI